MGGLGAVSGKWKVRYQVSTRDAEGALAVDWIDRLVMLSGLLAIPPMVLSYA